MIAKIQSLAGAGNPQAAKVELENLLVTFEQGTSSNENEIFKDGRPKERPHVKKCIG